MSDTLEIGVLYTEHSELKTIAPGVASLWSFESRASERGRPRITRNPEGSQEYWLDRSDPLLNTILPGAGVSIVLNFGELWAAGPSGATSTSLPSACVVGPVTQARTLHVGRLVRAIGAGVPSTLTSSVFAVPPSDLVDRIVPLRELWPVNDVERLTAFSWLEIRRGVLALRDALLARIGRPARPEPIGQSASRFIKAHAGRVSIDDMADRHGLSRQQFAHQFRMAAGLPPKLFARITRFQALVQVLLSTDVSQWVSVSSAVGFYDQAHMINEFHIFAGSAPTVFFGRRRNEPYPEKSATQPR